MTKSGLGEAVQPTAERSVSSHAVPLFEGPKSHRHQRRTFSELRAEARHELSGQRGYGKVRKLVQFAGFPRSGHSILGSILDAHPQALISHELDLMGIVDAGFEREEIFALIEANSRGFEENGRYWNGFCYAVPGGQGGRADPARVMGDKKGDWALRRLLDSPDLLSRLQARMDGVEPCWISVIRNPFDNVATLSLRKGREYDRLRIAAHDDAAFRDALTKEKGRAVSGTALPEMAEDYARLCDGLSALKARVPGRNWLEIRHEALVADPVSQLERMLDFLGLADTGDFCTLAAGIVSSQVNLTRHEVAWNPELKARIEGLIGQHDFLHGYSFDG